MNQSHTYLVTGADGFIGSHLVDALLAAGQRVVAVVRRTSRSQAASPLFANLGDVEKRPGLSVVTTDLTSSDAVGVLANAGCDVWFHLAADAFVDASLRQPLSVLSANLLGTAHVLEAARIAQPHHVLITSSSEVYGSHTGFISESCQIMPHTPYAASKASADRLAFAYWRTYQVPVTIVRPFNCFGPRHPYDVIPIFLRRAISGKELHIYGDGSQWRDFTYVDDTVRAFIALAKLEPAAEVYNVGSGDAITINDLAHAVREVAGSNVAIRHVGERPGDVQGLLCDAGKLQRTTGWQPEVDLISGLSMHAAAIRSEIGT